MCSVGAQVSLYPGSVQGSEARTVGLSCFPQWPRLRPYLLYPTFTSGHLRSRLHDLMQDADIGLDFQKILWGEQNILSSS